MESNKEDMESFINIGTAITVLIMSIIFSVFLVSVIIYIMTA